MSARLFVFCLFVFVALKASCEPDFREKTRDSCRAHVRESVPKYKIARTLTVKESNLIYLFLAVPSDSISRESLISLGCKLGEKYQNWDMLSAKIFTTRHAAENFHLPSGEGNALADIQALKADYICIRKGSAAGQELLYNDDPNSPYMTVQIDLGSPQ